MSGYLAMMMRKSLSTRLESRTAFVGVLLVGALGLSGLLAWHAFDAGRSHAEAVRKTLGEQARFAAWEYAGNARDFLDGKILYPGLEITAIAGGRSADVDLTMDRLRKVAAEKAWPYVDAVAGVFRVGLDDGSVAFAPASGRSPDLGDVSTHVEAWLSDTLRHHALNSSTPGWEPVMIAEPDLGGTFVYRLYPEERSESELLYGFVVSAGGLDVPLGYAFTESPLLPEGLTGGLANRDVFHVSVRDGAGRDVWSSEVAYSSDWTAADTVGTRYAGLVANVVVNPEVAPGLVIGGLPRSRLPMIVTLLLLTVGLVAGAFYQLRRETELAQLRADFVSGVSHELRTPLAQIRMFSETLLLGRVRNESERRRSLEIIVNESRRLTHQVDNVLLYSRTERNGMRVDAEDVRLDGLLQGVAESFEPLARAVDGRIELVGGPGCVARVDGALIRQALLNLLDNALKYGGSSHTIRMGLDVDPELLRLWVEDEGPGVPAEDRDRIWEPYYRRPVHRESAVAGSGIGLSIVRDVAEAHGGSATVEEAESGGARFVIAIPADVLSPAGAAKRPSRQKRSVAGAPTPAPAPARYGAE